MMMLKTSQHFIYKSFSLICCPTIHSSVHPFICPSIHLSVQPSVLPYASPFVCLSVHIFVCTIICPSIYQSIWLSVHQFVCTTICPSICQSICPFMCLPIHLLFRNLRSPLSSMNTLSDMLCLEFWADNGQKVQRC